MITLNSLMATRPAFSSALPQQAAPRFGCSADRVTFSGKTGKGLSPEQTRFLNGFAKLTGTKVSAENRPGTAQELRRFFFKNAEAYFVKGVKDSYEQIKEAEGGGEDFDPASAINDGIEAYGQENTDAFLAALGEAVTGKKGSRVYYEDMAKLFAIRPSQCSDRLYNAHRNACEIVTAEVAPPPEPLNAEQKKFLNALVKVTESKLSEKPSSTDELRDVFFEKTGVHFDTMVREAYDTARGDADPSDPPASTIKDSIRDFDGDNIDVYLDSLNYEITGERGAISNEELGKLLGLDEDAVNERLTTSFRQACDRLLAEESR